jgi:hypothetical protein
MSQVSFKPLPRLDQRLLSTMSRIVPHADRDEWTRTWHAELWHLRHSSRYLAVASIADISVGLTRDAMWLRVEALKRNLVGTPALCLGSLLGLALVSSLLGAGIAGTWSVFEASLANRLEVATVAGALVFCVAFATRFKRRVDQGVIVPLSATVQRMLFFLCKTLLVWSLAFVISSALSIPLRRVLPVVADLLQILNFVILLLGGLRWALNDQEVRCKQCLHSLAAAARIGRPSHNLLEWNGTELSCKQGHGLLSVPEMETSWREASQWVPCREA